MQRALTNLTNTLYDLLIIGGGIYGACVAWEASLRGFSVALIEKGDFASATSANSLKIIHGGFRYLQHADVKRLRESMRERRALMQMAPHLVHPLSVLIPTYGFELQSKTIFRLALWLNDLLSWDRNRGIDPQKHIPRGQVFSKKEVLQMLPGLPQTGLTGGALFYDAQVYNSERLVLAFLRSAVQIGAEVANYVQAVGFLKEKGRIIGVQAQDMLTGAQFSIRARMVVNTSGPWVDTILDLLHGQRPKRRIKLAKALNLVTRSLESRYAFGMKSPLVYQDADAVLQKGSRLLFITPWREYSLIGTAYAEYEGEPDDFHITEQEIQDFLKEINCAYPVANLKREDVYFVHGGLVPESDQAPKTASIQLAKRYVIYDHRQDGVAGLLSVVGVKYTTARHVAEKVVDHILESWGKRPVKSLSAITPLYGGEIDHFESFVQDQIRKWSRSMEEKTIRRLVYNYGTVYPEVLAYLEKPGPESSPDPSRLLRAEVLHAVHEEMAQKVSDVVLRRTEWGSAGYPGSLVIKTCAEVMGEALQWSSTRREQEWQETETFFKTRAYSVKL